MIIFCYSKVKMQKGLQNLSEIFKFKINGNNM